MTCGRRPRERPWVSENFRCSEVRKWESFLREFDENQLIEKSCFTSSLSEIKNESLATHAGEIIARRIYGCSTIFQFSDLQSHSRHNFQWLAFSAVGGFSYLNSTDLQEHKRLSRLILFLISNAEIVPFLCQINESGTNFQVDAERSVLDK